MMLTKYLSYENQQPPDALGTGEARVGPRGLCTPQWKGREGNRTGREGNWNGREGKLFVSASLTRGMTSLPISALLKYKESPTLAKTKIKPAAEGMRWP